LAATGWHPPLVVAEAEGGAVAVRKGIAIGLGMAIPGLSLSLSAIGGRLCVEGHVGLGVAALLLCSAVLAVSLSHVAWSVRDICRGCTAWQSWCIAVSADIGLVLGELVAIGVGETWGLVVAVQLGVGLVSMLLNCWAFCRQ
jgi:hypothetical protein